MKPGQLFPLAEQPNREDWKTLGLEHLPVKVRRKLCSVLPSLGLSLGKLKVKWTGEKRPPKKGEWFLSGAIVEGYRAPNDLSSSYLIGKLVVDYPGGKAELLRDWEDTAKNWEDV